MIRIQLNTVLDKLIPCNISVMVHCVKTWFCLSDYFMSTTMNIFNGRMDYTNMLD